MPAPMIDDLELRAVQLIRHEIEQDYARHRVAGLAGTLHQKLGRRSHRVFLAGFLLPESAADDLKTLQDKAAAGDEVSFVADITSALEIEHMVIESFRAEQEVGPAGQIGYALVLAENPPLPPPAELSPFGGLNDFGLGRMGFDPDALGDVLDDVAAQAGELSDLADAALDAAEGLQALASLGDLGNLANPIRPLAEEAGSLRQIGSALSGLSGSIGRLIGGG
jgi:hypothetical protein